MSDASMYIGVVMVAIGLWLAFTKSKKSDDGKFVGGGVDHNDIAED